MIPFTVEQFLNVFGQYNVAVWPAQVFLSTIGIVAVCLTLSRKNDFSRIVSLSLSFFWIWMGIVYHLWFFSAINKAALVFAALFVLEGILFFIAGVWKQQLTFRFSSNLYGVVGSVFLVYGLIVYPVLGYWLGHRYPAAPTFGLPCPTAIFTFGMFLWTKRRVPLYVVAIPLAWSVIGFWAAISLGMIEDLGLLVAGLIGSLLIVLRDTSITQPSAKPTP